MAPSTTSSSEKPAKKVKSKGAGGRKKKLSPFNKFMQTEMARLKEDEPELTHKERFKAATGNWKDSSMNPNNKEDKDSS